MTEPTVSRATIIGIALASALVPLNSTMVAVALPKLARAFGIGRGRAGMLITVYLVAMLIGQPLAGRVSDAFGNKRVVIVSLLGFGACSIGAALSPTFAWLVASRGLQAVFASALAPSVQSMLRSVTPQNERGHTFGILGSVIGVGAASGPIVGGALLSAFGWKAIFLVNLPVVAITLAVLSAVKIHATQPSSPVQQALTVLQGHQEEQVLPIEELDPIDTATTVRSGPVLETQTADTTRVGENWLETPHDSPIDEIPTHHPKSHRKSDLLQPTYLAAFATQAFSNLGQYSLLLIAPIVLDHRGWGSGSTGLGLSALTIGLIVMGPPGGRYGDTNGRRRAITNGLCAGALGTALLVPFDIGVPPALLVAALGLFGLGLGFASPSIIAVGLEAVPLERTGVAAGLLSASRYLGSIAASVMLSVFVADDGSGGRVMYIAAALALVLAIASANQLRPRTPPLKDQQTNQLTTR